MKNRQYSFIRNSSFLGVSVQQNEWHYNRTNGNMESFNFFYKASDHHLKPVEDLRIAPLGPGTHNAEGLNFWTMSGSILEAFNIFNDSICEMNTKRLKKNYLKIFSLKIFLLVNSSNLYIVSDYK